jgi:hypothetical protein
VKCNDHEPLLLKPRRVYQDPELVQRVMALMAE